MTETITIRAAEPSRRRRFRPKQERAFLDEAAEQAIQFRPERKREDLKFFDESVLFVALRPATGLFGAQAGEALTLELRPPIGQMRAVDAAASKQLAELAAIGAGVGLSAFSSGLNPRRCRRSFCGVETNSVSGLASVSALSELHPPSRLVQSIPKAAVSPVIGTGGHASNALS